MISIGKHRSDERKLEDLLTRPHRLTIRLALLDLDHNYKNDLSPYFADGQVSVDADADVTRSLDLTLLDPNGKVNLDFDEPSTTGVYITDMIRVYYVLDDPESGQEFVVPIFTGPVTSVERDDMILSVKALGKESLGLTNLWQGANYKKGQEKTYVIKSILQDLMGETKLSVPDASARMPTDRKLTRDDSPWKVAKSIAKTMNRQLFYDGRGVAVLRKKQNGALWKTTKMHLEAEPSIAYDLSTTINAVEVIGGTPKKHKNPLKAKAVAQRSHPLSPWRLGRGGQPRYLWMTIQDDSLGTVKECRDLAKQTLKHGLMAGITITGDGIINPVLQELDIIRVETDKTTVTLPLRKFTIPLIAGDSASYGYLKKMRPRGGHKPIKRHHHTRVGAR